MQDEHTPYGTKTPAASSAGTPESEVSKQWDAFQRDLDVLGRQLAERLASISLRASARASMR